jgi:hypothetical protein
VRLLRREDDEGRAEAAFVSPGETKLGTSRPQPRRS